MGFKKKKRSLKWHVEQKLDDTAMLHKKVIRKVQKKFDLSNYQLLWIAFAKGIVIGLIIL
jgi:hypothetical protein